MKIIKKIAAIMLSVMMVLGMCSVVGAEETSGSYGDGNGVITIQNAKKNQTYTIYRILKLESFSRGDKRKEGNYAYTLEEGWNDFLTNSSEYPTGNYLKKDKDTGYVTWDSTKTDYAAFAKDALKYVKAKSIAPAKEAVTTSEDGEVSFKDLPLGYYLIDSTAGALCSLDTTDKEVIIQEKNGVPSVDKVVKSGGDYKENNTASIGDKVEFKTTITAQPGAQNYVLHDKMDAGLTFDNTSIKINLMKSGETKESLVGDTNYTVRTPGLESENPCTFHIEFKQDFCDTLKANDEIIVTYTATLNESAKIAGEGNKNETWLKYGDRSVTNTDKTTTKTYEIPVFKYTLKNTVETALEDATFTLSKDSVTTSGKKDIIKLKKKDGTTTEEYLVNSSGTVTEITTGDTGKFKIQGLDAGTYYLTETQQPAGYNKLKDPITIKIDDKGNIYVNGVAEANKGDVKVLNNTGSLLPSTGGMGTTLFYIFGAILVIGSGVVLITKKRMK